MFASKLFLKQLRTPVFFQKIQFVFVTCTHNSLRRILLCSCCSFVFNFFKFSVVLYRMILLLNTFCKGNVDKGQKLCYLRNCFMKSINQQFSLCVCTFSKLRLHIINISMVLVYLFPMLTAYGYVVNIQKQSLHIRKFHSKIMPMTNLLQLQRTRLMMSEILKLSRKLHESPSLYRALNS